MGNNGHLQPSSRFPACIMAGELKILETKPTENKLSSQDDVMLMRPSDHDLVHAVINIIMS